MDIYICMGKCIYMYVFIYIYIYVCTLYICSIYICMYITIYIYNMQYTDKSKQRQGNPYVTRMITR